MERLRIFDPLLKACEERGFAVTIPDEHHPDAKIRVHGEELAVGLEEHNRRTDHLLSRREEEERRQGRGWRIPRYDYAPTGVLIFTIHEYTDGLCHRWSDRKNRPLESCLNEIIVALVRIALTVLRPRRLERSESTSAWLQWAHDLVDRTDPHEGFVAEASSGKWSAEPDADSD